MSEWTQVKISKKTADLIHIYCKINNLKLEDFVNQVLKERLNDFGKKLEEFENIRVA